MTRIPKGIAYDAVLVPRRGRKRADLEPVRIVQLHRRDRAVDVVPVAGGDKRRGVPWATLLIDYRPEDA